MRTYTKLPSDAKCTHIKGLYACPDGTVYGTDLKGIYKIEPYLNTNGGSSKWKYGYYKFHYNGVQSVHVIIARTFVNGYKKGLVVDHIDNDSRNNNASNLQWITHGANTEKFWDSLTEEEIKVYKKKYSDGLKRAHADGKYKKHLKELHEKKRDK